MMHHNISNCWSDCLWNCWCFLEFPINISPISVLRQFLFIWVYDEFISKMVTAFFLDCKSCPWCFACLHHRFRRTCTLSPLFLLSLSLFYLILCFQSQNLVHEFFTWQEPGRFLVWSWRRWKRRRRFCICIWNHSFISNLFKLMFEMKNWTSQLMFEISNLFELWFV